MPEQIYESLDAHVQNLDSLEEGLISSSIDQANKVFFVDSLFYVFVFFFYKMFIRCIDVYI